MQRSAGWQLLPLRQLQHSASRWVPGRDKAAHLWRGRIASWSLIGGWLVWRGLRMAFISALLEAELQILAALIPGHARTCMWPALA